MNAEKRDSQMGTCNVARIKYPFETYISISCSFAIRVIWLVVDLYSGVVCKEKLSRHQINWIKKKQFNCRQISFVAQFEISISRSIFPLRFTKVQYKYLMQYLRDHVTRSKRHSNNLSDIKYVWNIRCELLRYFAYDDCYPSCIVTYFLLPKEFKDI